MRIEPGTVHPPEIGPLWLNSQPLSLRQLRGSVVLIDFWDYTCVNCLRTLPYVKEWHERYGRHGLIVIGIHSPEFYFGRSPEVLERALVEFGIEYPVMLDNDYAAWKQFANRYWPTKYLIDAAGYMRYHQAGEGGYRETELALQELLRELHPGLALPEPMALVSPLDDMAVLAACPRPTPELYLGHRRGRILNQGGLVEDKVHDYQAGAGPATDALELAGPWNSLADCLAAGASHPADPSRLYLFYEAAEVNLVASPSGEFPRARIDIAHNGAPLDPEQAGPDVLFDSQGGSYLEVNRPRMYTLLRAEAFAPGILELSTTARGTQLFAFTFGSCPGQAA
jgi:thiol-disulfide isomerase/thioredoxin